MSSKGDIQKLNFISYEKSINPDMLEYQSFIHSNISWMYSLDQVLVLIWEI